MLDRLLKFLTQIPDHIHALCIILVGSVMCLVRPHDTAPAAVLAAGLSMWRGAPAKPE